MAVSLKSAGSDKISKLIAQYGCGTVKFTGTEEALYERHLLFDELRGDADRLHLVDGVGEVPVDRHLYIALL